LAKFEPADPDPFLAGGCSATGTWELVEAPDRLKAGEPVPTIRVHGDGFFSGGAFEDDDILYHGSGERKGVKVEVPLSTLRRDYTHTPFVPTEATSRVAAAQRAARAARWLKRWRAARHKQQRHHSVEQQE